VKVFILVLALVASGSLFADNLENSCKGNCREESSVPAQDQAQTQEQSQTQTTLVDGGEGGAGGSATNNIDFEDERQAPGVGLSTPSDSTGVGVTTPLFGLLFNLPWSWGDRKILPICDRLVETPEWGPCMCRTSVLKKLHDDQAACVTSLGGGSSDGGKTEEIEALREENAFLVTSAEIERSKYDEVRSELLVVQEEQARLREEQVQRTRTSAANRRVAVHQQQVQQQQIEELKKEPPQGLNRGDERGLRVQKSIRAIKRIEIPEEYKKYEEEQ